MVNIAAGARILGFLFDKDKSIFPFRWSFDEGIPEKHIPETWVTLVSGDGGSMGHASAIEPYITLWDDEGKRVGQHWAERTRFLWQGGDLSKYVYKIPNVHNRDPMVTAKYVMISQFAYDSLICLAAVQVSNGNLSTTWYGDLAAYCGARWYLSERRVGSAYPKCVWLSAEDEAENGARAISFHANDMLGTPSKILHYRMDQEKYLCRSTPRFNYWNNLQPDGTVPFYLPPLQYEIDQETGLEGRDKDPERAVDRYKWDKHVYIKPSVKGLRSLAPRVGNSTRTNPQRQQGFNRDTSHLLVTESEGHEASLVCNSTTSYGWDIASLKEKKYCDMTIRKLYDLCSSVYTKNCFDLERKILIGHGGINSRGEVSSIGVAEKAYKKTSHWK
ncbi:uncharacterized protein CTRU02_211565 [Colletotrichum truncatum]|uniref:Uncharacterized protein n=1 Tax=Colletotrichum truncatum TaxID=5467 RepID=A0ACC3YLC2_COLTU|nr:uncharacterized protein CTRU02_14071 [Colletotrichum truncatum]KAF6782590.1 hypothetical protein CTRU02_14071 [Colletotrichum truncatum]